MQPSENNKAFLRFFVSVLVFLFVFKVILAIAPLPVSIAHTSTLLVTVIFVALPILALYRAAAYTWTWRTSAAFLLIGVALHICGALIAGPMLKGEGFAAVLANSAKDSGIVCWAVGLGSLLASLVKDRNILVPVAIFLAGFDMFLVFNPTGPVQQFVVRRPEVAKAMTYSTPQVATEPGKVVVQSLAYVGPADFLFLSMFFVALFRFQMRTEQTLRWIVPVLLLYLICVVVFSGVSIGPLSLGALPALVPIGATVLLVNWREFKMKRDEVIATCVVGIISIGLAIYGIKRANDAQLELRAAPLKPVDDATTPK